MIQQEQLKEIAMRAKQVGIAIYGPDGSKDFDSVKIELDGKISVNFSHYCCGDTNNEAIDLDEEDLINPIEQTVDKYINIEKARVEKRRLEEQERQRKLAEAKEASELETYNRLKSKFDKSV